MKQASAKQLTGGIGPVLAVAACLATNAELLGQQHDPGPGNDLETMPYASPAALAATSDGKLVFVACATANQVAAFDTVAEKVVYTIHLPGSPSGTVLSKDNSRLYVTCAAEQAQARAIPVPWVHFRQQATPWQPPFADLSKNLLRVSDFAVAGMSRVLSDMSARQTCRSAPGPTLCVIDIPARRLIHQIKAGHTPMSPVLSPDQKMLYVCNRFDDDISVIDVNACREVKRIKVEREPFAAALTPNGKYLVVGNHLHHGPACSLHVGAKVSVIDTRTLSVIKNIPLPLGAGFVKGVAISPDGRFAAVTHLRSMHWLTTTAVELGRMNGAALSVLDLERLDLLGIVLLDRTGRGAANPWAVAWTADGQTIIVSHAGAHELSLVNAPVIADRASFGSTTIGAYTPTEMGPVPLPRQRPVRVTRYVALPGSGPRALTLSGSQLYVANYFSDSLCRIDLAAQALKAESLPLRNCPEPSLVRQGEMLFNDTRLCRQEWQSCASCHDTDARTDALNWDLLNDGMSNPKNTKSLVWAHQAGPAMALGVRTNAGAAVRAGIHHILFATEESEEVAVAIDAYLKSLKPLPSPHLENWGLTAGAERGRKLFMNVRTGCADCHPPPLFTDMLPHDVGTTNAFHGLYFTDAADKPSDRFYTPALVELWRTAPYLHDGSAVNLREILTAKNEDDMHGRTSQLQAQEIDDLVEYLLSL
jgi:YVTN family beta-propeller protein